MKRQEHSCSRAHKNQQGCRLLFICLIYIDRPARLYWPWSSTVLFGRSSWGHASLQVWNLLLNIWNESKVLLRLLPKSTCNLERSARISVSLNSNLNYINVGTGFLSRIGCALSERTDNTALWRIFFIAQPDSKQIQHSCRNYTRRPPKLLVIR